MNHDEFIILFINKVINIVCKINTNPIENGVFNIEIDIVNIVIILIIIILISVSILIKILILGIKVMFKHFTDVLKYNNYFKFTKLIF